jgi:hypothetical protein
MPLRVMASGFATYSNTIGDPSSEGTVVGVQKVDICSHASYGHIYGLRSRSIRGIGYGERVCSSSCSLCHSDRPLRHCNHPPNYYTHDEMASWINLQDIIPSLAGPDVANLQPTWHRISIQRYTNTLGFQHLNLKSQNGARAVSTTTSPCMALPNLSRDPFGNCLSHRLEFDFRHTDVARMANTVKLTACDSSGMATPFGYVSSLEEPIVTWSSGHELRPSSCALAAPVFGGLQRLSAFAIRITDIDWVAQSPGSTAQIVQGGQNCLAMWCLSEMRRVITNYNIPPSVYQLRAMNGLM